MLSQSIEVKIVQRIAKYQINIDNMLYWADKYGFIWTNDKTDVKNDICLVVGLHIIDDVAGKRIRPDDFEKLEKTYSSIKGTGKNSDNIKTVHFKGEDVVEFTASNISVDVRLNGTLKYGTDDLVKFEEILRKNKKMPTAYLDVYENVVYAK
jgi:hypothetical protein